MRSHDYYEVLCNSLSGSRPVRDFPSGGRMSCRPEPHGTEVEGQLH